MPSHAAAVPLVTAAGAVDALLARREDLSSVFQEIRDLGDGTIAGFEALLRLSPESALANPAEAFSRARDTGRLVELEIAALDTHLESAAAIGLDGRLFLNLSARAFLDPRLSADELAARARRARIEPRRIVLELTELVQLDDPVSFASHVGPLREAGFSLAVDDFGSGFSNVTALVELGPDFLKLDRTLVTGAGDHRRKQVFLEFLALLGRRINCAVVAEGIETEADLETARRAGIPYGQGWALGRPAPAEEAARRAHNQRPGRHERGGALAAPDERIGPLSALVEPFLSSAMVPRLVARFESDPELPAIPVVVDGSRVTGLVTRERLFFHLGHPYGFSLWRDRTAAAFLAGAGVVHESLPSSASLEEAAAVVRSREPGRRFDPIVVENDAGSYHGLLGVDVLLDEISRLKVAYALQTNPLSGLPGSARLRTVVEAHLAAGRPFAFGWADLDHFKPYNDAYGFARGDEVLLMTAEALRRHVGCRGEDFLAHPGGDDFAFVVPPAGAEERAWAAAREVSQKIPSFYRQADRDRGGLIGTDRLGGARFFPMVALSVGLVGWNGENALGYHHLVEVAAEVKSAAKASPGASVVRNRRALACD